MYHNLGRFVAFSMMTSLLIDWACFSMQKTQELIYYFNYTDSKILRRQIDKVQHEIAYFTNCWSKK